MEFSIFIQGYMPGPDAHNPVKEHEFLMKEMELVKAADKHNWKYVWLSEHHALPEYSHLSANEAVAGYLAASTERIHIGSGIFNLSPRVNHPVRTAEKVAMLDHLSNRRFEFGTGRGAGSHEVATFNIHDPSSTKSEYYEVLPEIVRMWEQKDYTFQGKHFQLDTPHDILPKPNGQGHPAIWRAVGSPGTWREAGERTAAVAAGSVPKAAPPRPGAKGADLLQFYGAVRDGDRAAIARLVNAGNVNLPLVMPNGVTSPQTPISGVLQHCGLPQVAPQRVASAVAQLVALGADPEQRAADGSTMLDFAKAACPPEVQQALLGRR